MAIRYGRKELFYHLEMRESRDGGYSDVEKRMEHKSDQEELFFTLFWTRSVKLWEFIEDKYSGP